MFHSLSRELWLALRDFGSVLSNEKGAALKDRPKARRRRGGRRPQVQGAALLGVPQGTPPTCERSELGGVAQWGRSPGTPSQAKQARLPCVRPKRVSARGGRARAHESVGEDDGFGVARGRSPDTCRLAWRVEPRIRGSRACAASPGKDFQHGACAVLEIRAVRSAKAFTYWRMAASGQHKIGTRAGLVATDHIESYIVIDVTLRCVIRVVVFNTIYDGV